MPRFVPVPDPGGSLDPPRRNPPTTLATGTPEPEPEPRHTAAAGYRALLHALKQTTLEPSGGSRISGWRGLVVRTLDLLDTVAGPISAAISRR